MSQQSLSLPNKYVEYLKQFILKITQKPFTAEYKDFQKIYQQVYNQTFQIHPILTKCNISDVQLESIYNQIKEMKQVYSRLQIVISKIKAQGVKIQIDKATLEELKFQTFLARNKINNQHFFNTLRFQYFFQLENKNLLLNLLKQIFILDDYKQQKRNIIKNFLKTNFEAFNDLDQQFLTQMISFILSRNDQLQNLIQKLSFISQKMIVSVIDFIFYNNQQKPNSLNIQQIEQQIAQVEQKQSQQDFSARVFQILKQKIKQFNIFNAAKKQLILTDLFNERQKGLNRQSIINIIKNSFVKFANFSIIDQLLLNIYHLKDASVFNQQQKNQQTQQLQQIKQLVKGKQQSKHLIKYTQVKETKVQTPKEQKKQVNKQKILQILGVNHENDKFNHFMNLLFKKSQPNVQQSLNFQFYNLIDRIPIWQNENTIKLLTKITKKMTQYFRDQILNKCNNSFNKIYQQVQNFHNDSTLGFYYVKSDYNRSNVCLELIKNQIQQMINLYQSDQSINEIIHGLRIQFQPTKLKQLQSQTYLLMNVLNNQSFLNTLKKQYCFCLKNQNSLLSLLLQLLKSQSNQQQNHIKLSEFLHRKYKNFNKYEQKVQMKMINFILSRNQSLQKLIKKLSSLCSRIIIYGINLQSIQQKQNSKQVVELKQAQQSRQSQVQVDLYNQGRFVELTQKQYLIQTKGAIYLSHQNSPATFKNKKNKNVSINNQKV